MATTGQLNKGGIAPAFGLNAPTAFSTGGAAAVTTTQGTDTTPVVTETYLARVFIPCNTTLTGIAILNGSAVAGNVTVALADSAGVPITGAKSASTAQSGTAAYQQFAFTTAAAVKGPGEYFVMVQFNNTSARFRTHALGNFKAGKLTSQTYGTIAAFTPPTGFTADLGPVADTY